MKIKLQNVNVGLADAASSTRGTAAATPPAATRVKTATSASSKRMAQPLAVAHLLAAYSAWAQSCQQARAARSSGKLDQTADSTSPHTE